MPETLLYRAAAEGWEWLRYDTRGELADAGSGNSEAFEAAAGGFDGDAVMVVPGEQVLLTLARVPSKNPRQVAQALPYAVEEQLASDVEDCFFAQGERTAEGKLTVAVVTVEQLEQWQASAQALSFETRVMVPEYELLPRTGAAALVDGERVHLSAAGLSRLTLPLSDLPLAVSLLSPQPEALSIQVTEAREDSVRLAADEIAAAGIAVEINASPHDSFKLLGAGYDPSALNLLQGPYRVEQARTRSDRTWLSVAGLAGFAVVLHLLLQGAQAWYLDRQASSLEQQSIELYRSIFPDDRNIRDLRRRWNAHIGAGGSEDGSFMPLFARSARQLESSGIRLNNINFNESRGDLILQVAAASSDVLVRYVQQLAGQGLDAEIGTINQEGESVRGSIRIRDSRGAPS